MMTPKKAAAGCPVKSPVMMKQTRNKAFGFKFFHPPTKAWIQGYTIPALKMESRVKSCP